MKNIVNLPCFQELLLCFPFAFALSIHFFLFVYICFSFVLTLIFDYMFTFLQTISHTYVSHIMTRVDSYSTDDSHFPVTHLTTHFLDYDS